jgi:hypothetical protein
VKLFLLLFLFFNFVQGAYKTVQVGTIDRYYENKITKEELYSLVKEVEQILESQVGFDLFGVSSEGSPISLHYVKPSLAQKRLERLKNKYEKKLKQKEELEHYLQNNIPHLDDLELEYKNQINKTNLLINEHNSYLEKVNNQTITSKEEYEKIKSYDKKVQSKIKKEQKSTKQIYKKLQKQQRKYNQKVIKHNNLITSINLLSTNIEQLSRSIKVVLGNAIFNTQIKKKTYLKDGKVYKIDIKEKRDEKIEIYGYETKDELKAIIAHEILHLVGIGHIDSKGALMNPILQENQKINLSLTPDDIQNIKNNF